MEKQLNSIGKTFAEFSSLLVLQKNQKDLTRKTMDSEKFNNLHVTKLFFEFDGILALRTLDKRFKETEHLVFKSES